jgi:hypothetical protein
VYELRRRLQAFRDGFSETEVSRSDEHQMHLTNWVKDRLSQALKSTQNVYPRDAAALIETAKEYDEKMFEDLYVTTPTSGLSAPKIPFPLDLMTDALSRIKPFIARCVADSNFSNSLAVEILSFSRSSNPDKDLIARIVPLVLHAATDQF